MSTKFSNRPVYEQSTEEHQAAGRMGGKARGNQRQHEDDDDNTQPSKRSRSNSSQGNNGKMSRSEAGRKGGLTRAKNQGQGQYQQRGNDFDPDADKYGYDEGDYQEDSIAAHTRSHDQGNDNNDADYTEPNDEPQGRSSGKRSSKQHSDFEQGKNPNRQAVSRRVARERGHEAFVEMGRKGGHGNAGIHADLDFDDMDSFREHPEMGVPAKNPNRVRGGKQAAEKRGHDELSEMGRKGGEMQAGRPKFGGAPDNGEDDNESFNMRDVKDPNRVSGGIRAANKQSHESFVERGKMGAEARWGNNRQSGGRNQGQNDDEEEDDDDQEEQSYDGKNMNRVRGGQKAAQTRAENGTQYRGGSRSSNQRGGQSQGNDDEEEDDDSGMNDDDSSQGGRSTSRQQAGKKAAETRARNGTQYRGGSRPSGGNNRQSQGRNNQDDEEDDQNMDDDNEDDSGKDSTRVQGGKKAAETRARNGTQYRGGSRPSGGNSGGSGGNSRGSSGNGRGGNTNQGKQFEIEEDDDDYSDMNQDHFEDDQGKNPNRVRGGQKAASHFTHEELSERARRAAQTRAQNGTQSRNGSGISRNRQSQGGNNDDDMDYE